MNSNIISIDNWQQNGNFSIAQNSCQLISFTQPAYAWVPQINFSVIGTPFSFAYYEFDGLNGPVVCKTTEKTTTIAFGYSLNLTSPISLDEWNKAVIQGSFDVPSGCSSTNTTIYLHVETSPDIDTDSLLPDNDTDSLLSATILTNSSSALSLHFSIIGLMFNASYHSGPCSLDLTTSPQNSTNSTNSTNSSLTNSTTTQTASAASKHSGPSLTILALVAFIAIVPLVV